MDSQEKLEQDKPVRLLNFLEELSRIRTRTVKDIDSYHKVLWLHEIPKNSKHCFTRAWGPTEDVDADIWIQIRKYDEPVLEDVPESCEDWIDNEKLYDTSIRPELKDSISIEVEEENPEWTEKDPEEDKIRTVNRTLNLKDHPDIVRTWNEFVDDKWVPWAELYNKWEEVQNVYSTLFSMHQDQLKLGEEYELVVGLGFLRWETEKGYYVKRHLIVANANLDFDARIGKFTVNPAIDGAKVIFEFDMLEPDEQPPYKARKVIEESLQSSNDDPWNKSVLDTAQKALVNVLGQGQGEFHANGLGVSDDYDRTKPVVNFAPALILRKRNVRNLQRVIQSIREQIKKGVKIPKEFIDLSEGKIKRERVAEEEDISPSEDSRKRLDDYTVYFPLPSNEKQNEIISKLKFTSGVLVQGPPGTGKSHTIANLICHLLATGKRVLVTSKASRALRVLQDKLPEEIQPLCINLLGSGIEEQRSLESSVTNILAKQDQWNEHEADDDIKRGKEVIFKLKKEKAEIEYKLRSVRESESFKHSVIDGTYVGTAAKIALKIRKERDLYAWFEDDIAPNLTCPFSIDDLKRLRTKLKDFSLVKKEQLRLKLPMIGKEFPDLDTFTQLVQEERRLIEKTNTRDEIVKTDLGQCLNRTTDIDLIHSVIKVILSLNAAVDSVSKRPLSWIKGAVYDILSDKDTPWRDLLTVLGKKLEGLKEKSYSFENIKFEIPEMLNKKKLLVDAKGLYEHIDKGGKLGFWITAPKVVRKGKYIFKEVKIDSQNCNDKSLLKQLVDFLELQDAVDYCWSLWDGKVERAKGPLFIQLGELEELKEALESVISLYSVLTEVKKTVLRVSGLGEIPWHDKEAVTNLLNVCQVYVSIYDLEKLQKEFDAYQSKIKVFKNNTTLAHPLTDELLDVISRRDIDSFSGVLSRMERHKEEADDFVKINDTLNTLSKLAPIFSEKLSSDLENRELDKNIYQFEHAWNWARARAWLKSVLTSDNVQSLESRVRQIKSGLEQRLADLASLMAWKFCFARMTDAHRRHLMGWQQAIKKIGKGTGKHAPKHRKDAQGHLNQCRDAVPAWVMPLHRVYETVDPKPEVFDVIIVDEASQCGPEGLPLTFLGKQIVVVGDDQQISPDPVGITQDRVHSLMDEYLHDFEHADSFAPDSSLFDHGKRRFHNRIVLREHFRCMPEIIRFSNDLCYNATPLIPLRQYPPERLEPLVMVHVPQGFREGATSSSAINRPEAEALVEKIVQCCNDEKYENKTMGVIILQGEAQAALIENMLLEQLGAEEMEQRRLICGNPYSFQGDERNIIFLSMIADSNVRNVFNKPADQRRFNVAASRAQDQMWLFHTATVNDLSQHCLRNKLLGYFNDPRSQLQKALGDEVEELVKLAFNANRSIEKAPAPFDSWFEVDVALKIAAKGYRVVPQFPFAGKKIDIVIEGQKAKLAVECYGDYWHGPDTYESDLERQRLLERCGWHFYIIRECSFNANPDSSLEKLWLELDKRGIQPVNTERTQPENTGYDSVNSKDVDVEEEMLVEQVSSTKENLLFPVPSSTLTAKRTKTQRQLEQKVIKIDNIKQALAIKPADIRGLIVKTLRSRPNCSCVKDALAGLILKNLNVISRGKPRKEFSRKVNQALRYLERNGLIEVYKSKNVRARLVYR